MKRLHVKLVLALQFDKPHCRTCCGFRDPFGVAIVVLLSLDVGPDIFRRHQPDGVAVRGENAAEMMGAAASLHADNALRKLLRHPNQRLASHLTPHHDRAGRIEANHAAEVLTKIDAKNRDCCQSFAERTFAGLMRALEACADIFKSAERTNYFAACGCDTT